MFLLFILILLGYFSIGFAIFCIDAYVNKSIFHSWVFAWPLLLLVALILLTSDTLTKIGMYLGGKRPKEEEVM